jgi:short-chain Z-isoprenyl diphosphate synthase
VLYGVYERRLMSSLDRSRIPRHVGVILDGNRRWAALQGGSTAQGHRAGADKIAEFLGWCEEAGVEVVTLWLLSTDNLTRQIAELDPLLGIIESTVGSLAAQGHWRVHPVGALDLLPAHTAAALKKAESDTVGYDGLLVNVAVGYGGRREIVDAVRALLAEPRARAPRSTSSPSVLDVDHIAEHLYTAGQPDPDLVIRTSGEQRLSGFLLWQSAHSEFYFCEAYWPDFRKVDFLRALRIRSARSQTRSWRRSTPSPIPRRAATPRDVSCCCSPRPLLSATRSVPRPVLSPSAPGCTWHSCWRWLSPSRPRSSCTEPIVPASTSHDRQLPRATAPVVVDPGPGATTGAVARGRSPACHTALGVARGDHLGGRLRSNTFGPAPGRPTSGEALVPAARRRPTASRSSEVRTYVLDTSVLLSDPHALLRFDEHEVVSRSSWSASWRAKRAHPELGYFARQALRLLDDLRVSTAASTTRCGLNDAGGTLRVELNHTDPRCCRRLPARLGDNDTRILAVAATWPPRAATSPWSPRTCRCG